MWVYTCEYRYLQRPEEDIRFSGAGVTIGCKLLDVGARNQTQAFYRSSILSQPQGLLSSSFSFNFKSVRTILKEWVFKVL